MKWFSKKAPAVTPPAPSGVWVEYADGTRYENLPTVYVSTDDNGIALFDVIVPRDDERPTSLGAAAWPGMTGLEVALAPGSEIP